MSNFGRRRAAALPWRRWRLSRPLPGRGSSVLRTGSSRESLAGPLEPNDTTAGPLLAAGESRTACWPLAAPPGAQRRIRWPCPKIALTDALLPGRCRLSKRSRRRTPAKPRAKSFPVLSRRVLPAAWPGGPPARALLTGEEVMQRLNLSLVVKPGPWSQKAASSRLCWPGSGSAPTPGLQEARPVRPEGTRQGSGTGLLPSHRTFQPRLLWASS